MIGRKFFDGTGLAIVFVLFFVVLVVVVVVVVGSYGCGGLKRSESP